LNFFIFRNILDPIDPIYKYKYKSKLTSADNCSVEMVKEMVWVTSTLCAGKILCKNAMAEPRRARMEHRAENQHVRRCRRGRIDARVCMHREFSRIPRSIGDVHGRSSPNLPSWMMPEQTCMHARRLDFFVVTSCWIRRCHWNLWTIITTVYLFNLPGLFRS